MLIPAVVYIPGVLGCPGGFPGGLAGGRRGRLASQEASQQKDGSRQADGDCWMDLASRIARVEQCTQVVVPGPAALPCVYHPALLLYHPVLPCPAHTCPVLPCPAYPALCTLPHPASLPCPVDTTPPCLPTLPCVPCLRTYPCTYRTPAVCNSPTWSVTLQGGDEGGILLQDAVRGSRRVAGVPGRTEESRIADVLLRYRHLPLLGTLPGTGYASQQGGLSGVGPADVSGRRRPNAR